MASLTLERKKKGRAYVRRREEKEGRKEKEGWEIRSHLRG
jgi:ribosomal protein S10